MRGPEREIESVQDRDFCTYVLCLNEIQREGGRLKISVSRIYARGTKRERERVSPNLFE